MKKQLHLECSVCKAKTTVPVLYENARLSYFLGKVPHKMDCYGNSIKMEVNTDQSSDSGHRM